MQYLVGAIPPGETGTWAYCSNCLRAFDAEKTSGSQCSKCHLAQYCSRECQKKTWKSHKRVCEKVFADTSGVFDMSYEIIQQERTMSKSIISAVLSKVFDVLDSKELQDKHSRVVMTAMPPPNPEFFEVHVIPFQMTRRERLIVDDLLNEFVTVSGHALGPYGCTEVAFWIATRKGIESGLPGLKFERGMKVKGI